MADGVLYDAFRITQKLKEAGLNDAKISAIVDKWSAACVNLDAVSQLEFAKHKADIAKKDSNVLGAIDRWRHDNKFCTKTWSYCLLALKNN